MKRILLFLLALSLLCMGSCALAEQSISLEVVNEARLPLHEAEDPYIQLLRGTETAPTDGLPVLILPVKKNLQINTRILPQSVRNKKVTMEVDNADIVRVKGNSLTGLAAGETVLTIVSQADESVKLQYRVLVIQQVSRISLTAAAKSVAVGDTLDVTAPRYREDIEVGEPDLAEEVIREYGYDHVIPTFLKAATVTTGGKTPAVQRRERVCRILCGQGYHEVCTLSFFADSDLDFLRIPADAPERNVLRIKNPISVNLAIMRPLLIPSLMNIVVENLKKGNNEGRIFELSHVYIPREKGEMPDERPHLGFAAFGDQEDFFTVKGTVEALAKALGLTFEMERAQDVPYLHPGIAAYILCEGERIGCFGKLANEVTGELKLHKDAKSNHKIFLGEIDYQLMRSHMAASFRYQPLSAFPPVIRDLALTVAEETPCGDLMKEISKACPRVSDVELFDIYRGEQIGEGRKSMAFKIRSRAWRSRSGLSRRTRRCRRKKWTGISRRFSAISSLSLEQKSDKGAFRSSWAAARSLLKTVHWTVFRARRTP